MEQESMLMATETITCNNVIHSLESLSRKVRLKVFTFLLQTTVKRPRHPKGRQPTKEVRQRPRSRLHVMVKDYFMHSNFFTMNALRRRLVGCLQFLESSAVCYLQMRISLNDFGIIFKLLWMKKAVVIAVKILSVIVRYFFSKICFEFFLLYCQFCIFTAAITSEVSKTNQIHASTSETTTCPGK